MPDFKQWVSSCLVIDQHNIKLIMKSINETLKNTLYYCQTYDHFRDSYKMYINGEQTESGTWAGDNPQDPIRPGNLYSWKPNHSEVLSFTITERPLLTRVVAASNKK